MEGVDSSYIDDVLAKGSDTIVENGWTWPEEDKANWHAAPSRIQEFYTKWRGATFPELSTTAHPYEIEVELSQSGKPLLQFHSLNTAGTRILVPRSYDEIFRRLMHLRRRDLGSRKGAVITGQPGTGKSTFLEYTLIRLLSASQGAPVDGDSVIWPIQVSGPNPIRWKYWLRQTGGREWGMPLWSFTELLCGLRLQANYVEYRNNLAKALSAESTEPSAQDPEITDALRVLRRQKDRNLDSMQDNVDADMVEINQKNEVDDAIELLVQNATEEFGFAPRDVFDAIFKPRQTRDAHAQALESFDYNDLQSLAKTFRDQRALSYHQSRIIVMSPYVKDLKGHDGWRIDFKSIRIAKSAVLALMEKDDQYLSEMFWCLCHFTESISLAGHVFEAVAHRMLSGRSRPDPKSQVICMHSVNKTSSLFSSNIPPSSSVPLSRIPHRVLDSNRPRKVIQINLGDSFIT